MKKTFIEVFGWYGTAAILSAYILLNFKLINSASILYQLLNITGAAGIITVSINKKVYETVVLNIIWGVVGIITLLSLLHK